MVRIKSKPHRFSPYFIKKQLTKASVLSSGLVDPLVSYYRSVTEGATKELLQLSKEIEERKEVQEVLTDALTTVNDQNRVLENDIQIQNMEIVNMEQYINWLQTKIRFPGGRAMPATFIRFFYDNQDIDREVGVGMVRYRTRDLINFERLDPQSDTESDEEFTNMIEL